jgi:hypothetical protein
MEGGHHFTMGDVGANARVQQGWNLTWSEATLSSVDGGDELRQGFERLLNRLSSAPDLDEPTRELACEKTAELANSLGAAADDPGRLHRALLEARGWLLGTATWAWRELSELLASDPAQKLIGTVVEAGTKAAITSLTRDSGG